MSKIDLIFNMDDVLKNIERTLGGMSEEKKGEWIRRDESAFLSQDGVLKIMSIMKTHLNKTIYLSDLTPQFIRRKRIAIFTALYINLHKNKKAFGIQDIASIRLILECIDTSIYASLRQGLDGSTSRRYYATVHQNILMGQRGGDGQGGGLPGL
jgi:hypothetical protein